MSDEQNSQSFEQKLLELEQVVAEMDKSDVPLEVLVAQFEQGLRLRRQLEEMLSNAELRIEELLGEEGLETKPFDASKEV